MIEISDEQELRPDLAESLVQKAEQVLGLLGLSHATVSLLLCDDPAIQALNAEWRQKDTPTDVLSFPMLDEALFPYIEGEEPWPKEFQAQDDDYPLLLGDIVISVETCIRQAQEWEHTELDEALRLWTHGLLHLCGYDHEEPEDAVLMRSREDGLLQEIVTAHTTPLTTLHEDR
ncbi:MAG: rRNA maturation RNase YbeY [Myxococcales bacterium]|nr:rRNA maturation RNase YbeY [Myxococcales bacterium]MCB9642026.1 rRNA maturation RNase YbeY [Myxococcales bacterium]